MTVQSEYRDLPLTALAESSFNPRCHFDEAALAELAESIRAQGILAPLVVRPVNTHFEIVAGARRFRAAQMAGLAAAPVRIVEMTDAEALEASIVENLQRRDVHPLDEAQGFTALMRLGEPPLTAEQIAAKCGKSSAYVAGRLRLTELVAEAAEAFAKDEIGVGHALLLAKLQPKQQKEALAACYQEQYTNGSRSKSILLPVRHLQQWIERNILLELASAPFSREDAQLLPEAGACTDCPKRTGHNTLLFEGIGTLSDSCSDPRCYAAKVDAHVRRTLAAKPKLLQISTAYGVPKQGSEIVPRNRYVEIRQEQPTKKEQQSWPEYKSCKFTTEAIVAEGNEKGEMRRVCANAECPIHHARKPKSTNNAALKAEEEKRRREEAIAQVTGMRVLEAVANAIPVRLMKRDLLFVAERLALTLDERRLGILFKLHKLGKANGQANSAPKLFSSFLHKADESTLGRLLVELAIVQPTGSAGDTSKALREAADFYKVDIAAITAKVKQEFTAKDVAKSNKSAHKQKATKKRAAA